MDEIEAIVNLMEKFASKYLTHPNDSAKLYTVSRLVDLEIGKRMAIINERNENEGVIFVGHCGIDGKSVAVDMEK